LSLFSLFLSFHVYQLLLFYSYFFFFSDSSTSEIYTLSLHDALPISTLSIESIDDLEGVMDPILYEISLGKKVETAGVLGMLSYLDRKSTRLNSSHVEISYAVFCLKKKNNEYVLTNCLLINIFNQCFT